LEKRKKEIQKKVKEIEQQMELLEKAAQEQSPDKRNEEVDVQAGKGWKKMTLNY
jgi:50S ribosomal subunit-associated GTPase HflX